MWKLQGHACVWVERLAAWAPVVTLSVGRSIPTNSRLRRSRNRKIAGITYRFPSTDLKGFLERRGKGKSATRFVVSGAQRSHDVMTQTASFRRRNICNWKIPVTQQDFEPPLFLPLVNLLIRPELLD
jgi:hypothetical protein